MDKGLLTYGSFVFSSRFVDLVDRFFFSVYKLRFRESNGRRVGRMSGDLPQQLAREEFSQGFIEARKSCGQLYRSHLTRATDRAKWILGWRILIYDNFIIFPPVLVTD